MTTELDKPLMEAPGKNGYHVQVMRYMFGQMRVQLIDTKRPDFLAPGRGQIVREMCTYVPLKAMAMLAQLSQSDDPEACAESFAKPYNCEGKGGRIRLDNMPWDKDGVVR